MGVNKKTALFGGLQRDTAFLTHLTSSTEWTPFRVDLDLSCPNLQIASLLEPIFPLRSEGEAQNGLAISATDLGIFTTQAKRSATKKPAGSGLFLLVLLALVEDLGDDTCTHGSATLTDCKTQALFHRNRGNQLSNKVDVVARHHHLNTLR